MYKVEISPESFERAAIERRRRLDQERMKRIFDPKIRVLGIDVQALEDQIHMKNEIKRIEAEREQAFAKSMSETNQLLHHLDLAQSAARRTHLVNMNAFRAAHQAPHQRRDYDLYDPTALKRERPPRVADSDGSVSGLQRFEGEDLSEAARRREQKSQMRVWALQGIKERAEERRREEEERRLYGNFQHMVLQRGLALQRAVDDTRSAIARADNEYNRQLADQRRQKEEADFHHEQMLNAEEIYANVTGPLLTETPDVFNIGAGHKVRVDLFKGITPEQKREILRGQEQQRIEAERKRALQREEEFRWAVQEAANNAASLALEREKERQRREAAIGLRVENSHKAEDDGKRKQWIDMVLYTNPPSEDYFAQFNTTSR